MIREVKFESQDRRIKGIIEALNANGIKDIEEANAICEAAGLDPSCLTPLSAFILSISSSKYFFPTSITTSEYIWMNLL